MTRIANQGTSANARVSLRTAAARLRMSPLGLQKLLARTNSLIRDDGRWFVDVAIITKVQEARAALGLRSRNEAS